MIIHLSEDVAPAAQQNFDLEHACHFLDKKNTFIILPKIMKNNN